MTTTATATFLAGETLTTRFIGDWDSILTATVISRTAKRITLKVVGYSEPKTVGILKDSDGNEFCFPLGRYSMAATFKAQAPSNVVAFA